MSDKMQDRKVGVRPVRAASVRVYGAKGVEVHTFTNLKDFEYPGGEESAAESVRRVLGGAMVGLLSGQELDWYMVCSLEIDQRGDYSSSDRCRRKFGRRLVERLFRHVRQGRR